MATYTGKNNPYIAGRSLGQERGFFGREDILRLVQSRLQTPEQGALVLFGQRRIGKTSILLQIQRRLPSPPFLAIYFDLMDRAQRPLGRVLYELASAIAAEAGMPQPVAEQFDDRGHFFRRSFLPSLYSALGEDHIPVLLLDEFDVLDVAASEQLGPNSAAQTFFPYLRELLEGEPRLRFVFVVGRRAEDLSINVKATFKASLYQRVSVLDEANARELIATAERQGSLRFAPDAVERIIGLTAGHPYFVQLLCQLLWDAAYAQEHSEVPLVDAAAVEDAAARSLEAGQNIFEWVWEGLPPAERIIFAAIAGSTDEQTVIGEDQIIRVLQSQGVRILTRELELAPRTLAEWEMLRQVDGGYRFFIELMRRWVATRKPLPRVKNELDRIVPLADTLFRSAEVFARQGDSESSEDQLRKALRINPNHLKARLLLGQVLLEANKIDSAVRELEQAYSYDEDAARYAFVNALLQLGSVLEHQRRFDEVLAVYKRVLAISPNEKAALQRRRTLGKERGDKALKDGNLELALRAYREIDESDPAVLSAIAKMHEQRGEWQQASSIYQELVAQSPEDAEAQRGLRRTQDEQELSQRYHSGMQALERGDRVEAVRDLAAVLSVRPDYKDVGELVAHALRPDLVPRAKPAASTVTKPVSQRGYSISNIITAILALIVTVPVVWGGITRNSSNTSATQTTVSATQAAMAVLATQTIVAMSSQPIIISVKDEKLAFDKVMLTVPANIPFSVTFENTSLSHLHSWVLIKGGEDVAGRFANTSSDGYLPSLPEIIMNSRWLNSNDNAAFNIPALSAGTYTYICTLKGHYAAGMKGTLIVQ